MRQRVHHVGLAGLDLLEPRLRALGARLSSCGSGPGTERQNRSGAAAMDAVRGELVGEIADVLVDAVHGGGEHDGRHLAVGRRRGQVAVELAAMALERILMVVPGMVGFLAGTIDAQGSAAGGGRKGVSNRRCSAPSHANLEVVAQSCAPSLEGKRHAQVSLHGVAGSRVASSLPRRRAIKAAAAFAAGFAMPHVLSVGSALWLPIPSAP